MAIYFLYVTYTLSAVVFGLEFLGCIFAGIRQKFGFPALYLAISCVFGLISNSLIAAVIDGRLVDFSMYPGYLHVVTLFNYLQFLMLLFLPVLAVFLLIRQRKQRKFENGNSGTCQSPKALTILVYLGFFYAVVALIMLFVSMGLSSRINDPSISTSEIIAYADQFVATDMILWFYISFWIIVACFHRSIQLQHVSSFIGYGVLMTLPMIITTIADFLVGANSIFDAGQYAFFFLYDVPIFFAVALALVYAHRWIALPEQEHHSPSA